MDAGVHSILKENGINRYHIEYEGFLSNHMTHGVIALSKIGAEKKRITQFVDWYSKKLESSTTMRNEEIKNECNDVSEPTKGSREMYYTTYDLYMRLLREQYDGSMSALISEEFPGLIMGMIGSALHGLIHLGYGFAAESDNVVCEGMAYLHYSSMPLRVSEPTDLRTPLNEKSNGTNSFVEVLRKVREDTDLINFMLTEYTNEKHDKLLRLAGSSFQKKVAVLFTFKADELIKYFQLILLPHIGEYNTDHVSFGQKIGHWLIDSTLWVYLASEFKNDFFLIHGVTSSWALRGLLQQLNTLEDVTLALRVHICIIIATYLAQNSPFLQDDHVPLVQDPSFKWSTLIKKTLEEDRDEHVYKMVQVCYDMDSTQCTPAQSALYREAARAAVENPLGFQ